MKGQCLCGNVRWVAEGVPSSVHHCHCSMCRRWTGAAFATLVWFDRDSVRWPGARPKAYRASPIAVRSHCDICGTPIHLAYDGKSAVAFSAGSAEHPERLEPTHHYGIAGELGWADLVTKLPGRVTEESW